MLILCVLENWLCLELVSIIKQTEAESVFPLTSLSGYRAEVPLHIVNFLSSAFWNLTEETAFWFRMKGEKAIFFLGSLL